jgi:putative Ca2+/H+ antiporter (TMEM165/GDT1 family)
MLKLFISVLAVTFFAELPDKTALTNFVLSSRRNPLAVFAGGAMAMLLHTALAVWLGSLVGALPERWVRLASGAVFLVFAVLMWRRKPEAEDPAEGGDGSPLRFLEVASASFLAIFLAEWGDLTQFSTAAMAAKFQQPWVVFAGAVAGLWCAMGLTGWLGSMAGKALNHTMLQKIAAAVFFGVGLWILLGH